MEIQNIHDDEINLLEYWNVLWRRKYLLILLSVVTVSVTMFISIRSPKFYKSQTTIMTSGSESGGLGSALSALPFAGALGGVGGQNSSERIMVILKSRTIAEAVINKYDLMRVFNENKWDSKKGAWKDPEHPPLMEDIVQMITTDVTNIGRSKEGAITISVEWTDPVLAANIANSYVTALTGFMNEKSVNLTIQVIDIAVPAQKKSRPSIRRNMILAGMASLFIGLLIVFSLEYLSKQNKKSP